MDARWRHSPNTGSHPEGGPRLAKQRKKLRVMEETMVQTTEGRMHCKLEHTGIAVGDVLPDCRQRPRVAAYRRVPLGGVTVVRMPLQIFTPANGFETYLRIGVHTALPKCLDAAILKAHALGITLRHGHRSPRGNRSCPLIEDRLVEIRSQR